MLTAPIPSRNLPIQIITVLGPFLAATMTSIPRHLPSFADVVATAGMGVGGEAILDAVDEEGPEGGVAGGPDDGVDFVARWRVLVSAVFRGLFFVFKGREVEVGRDLRVSGE